jgi:LAO/AO transport system kinase
MSLVAAVLAGERLALARLLTQVENETPAGLQALNELFPFSGRAHLIGVTGAPGTGKSSLVNQLARHYRHPPEGATPSRVAIVAVDPSSPFTGGAILGDRVRMRDLAGDPGIFIRSMAARGALGGLAHTTGGLVQVLDAAGFEIILIETVGAGQAEVEVARLAHTTLVVEAPGLGDDIQAIKAGILEIADILVINKADHPGVESTERALRAMLQLGHPMASHPMASPSLAGHPPTGHHGAAAEASPPEPAQAGSVELWSPPLLRTIATEGTGVGALAEAICRHAEYLRQTGELARRQRYRLQVELDSLLREALMQRWRSRLAPARYQAVLDQLAARQLSPRQAATVLLDGTASESFPS